MGSVANVRMKPKCLPSKFECHAEHPKRILETSKTELRKVLKKPRLFHEEFERNLEERNLIARELEVAESSSSAGA